MEKVTRPEAPGKPLGARLLDTLASVRFALSVVALIAGACLVGTLIPQGPDAAAAAARDPGHAARWELLAALGLTNVYSAPWFVGLLCVLGASVATCGSRRFVVVKRGSGFSRVRAFGSMLTHLSILLVLAGGVVRGVWGVKGTLALREGETRGEFHGEDGATRPLPFTVRLARFEIETYGGAAEPASPDGELRVTWPAGGAAASVPVRVGAARILTATGGAADSFRVSILRYVPDFVVDTETREVSSRSQERRNPAILVAVSGPGYANHRWLFARFPDFVMHVEGGEPTGSPLEMVFADAATSGGAPAPGARVKSFRSTLEILEGGVPVETRTVEVNGPLSLRGFRLFQSGYDPNDLSWTSLQVVRDPGVPLVYTGFALMLVGLFIVFYLNPWLSGRARA
jgi:cytochrome c biogenesis protein ResB